MDEAAAREAVRRALAEDRAGDDATTRLLGAASGRAPATARFAVEESCVVAGVPLVTHVFGELDPAARVIPAAAEGERVDSGALVVTVRGSVAALLAGERVALNFLQRLCGVATETRRVADSLAGTAARVTHTRKTTPGLRALECYAVRMGGGVANRASLADAVMWKDNHWALLDQRHGGLAQVLRAVPAGIPVIVEVETEAQLEEALAAGVGHLLIDNQPPERFAAWARRAPRGTTLQASGGITLESARRYADAGATLISIGALTHSPHAAAIGCAITLD